MLQELLKKNLLCETHLIALHRHVTGTIINSIYKQGDWHRLRASNCIYDHTASKGQTQDSNRHSLML